MVMFILQSLFLIAAAFVLGAILGNIFKRLSPKKPSIADGSTHAADMRLASQSTLLAVNDDVMKSAVEAAAMIPPAEPIPSGPAKTALKSPSKPEPQPAMRNPHQDDRNRPTLLKKARRGKPDKLTEIDGIGTSIEAKLFTLGIFHYDQIAAWTVEQADWVSIEIGFVGRALRESWVKQASALIKKTPAKSTRKPVRG